MMHSGAGDRARIRTKGSAEPLVITAEDAAAIYQERAVRDARVWGDVAIPYRPGGCAVPREVYLRAHTTVADCNGSSRIESYLQIATDRVESNHICC